MALKVGVIGVGIMGKFHARVYAELEETELIGVADVNISAAQEIANTYDVRAFVDYKELLSHVEAVSVCVPTKFHRDVCLAAIQAEKHILCEKPITAEVHEAEEVLQALERTSLKFMVGHIERFNPMVIALKKCLEGEEIKVINTTRVGPRPPRIKDVGVVTDIGVHDIDLIKYLSQSGFSSARSVVQRDADGVDDVALLLLQMENGVLANSTVDWLTPIKIRELRVVTKNKLFIVDLMGNMIEEYSNYQETENRCLLKKIPVHYEEPLKKELREFALSVINDTPVPVSIQDGIEVLKIAKQCLEGN